MSVECCNCGKPVTDEEEMSNGYLALCLDCLEDEQDDSDDEMTRLLEEGIEVEFFDIKTGKTFTETYKKQC